MIAGRSGWTLATLLGARLLVASGAQAQVEIRAAGVTAQARSAVLVAGAREVISGLWWGGNLELQRGKLLLSGRGMWGTLTPDPSTPAIARDIGEVAAGLRIAPTDWLGLEAAYTVRAFSSAAGYQRWNIVGAGVGVSGKLGDPAVRAYLRGAYLPSVTVTGQPSPSLGLTAEAGVIAEARGAPVLVGISYRLERYDFPGGAGSRLEQFDQISLRVGLVLPKRARAAGSQPPDTR